MKFLKSISLFCVLPLLVVVIGFFLYTQYESYFYPGKSVQGVQERNNSRYGVPNGQTQNIAYEETAGLEEMITTCDTHYEIIEHNTVNNTDLKKEGKLPEKYLGMNRQSFETAMKEYELSPTLEDQKKGFVSLILKSFSDDRVVVQKNYRPEEKNTGYYLVVENGRIAVYENDRTTLYMNTDIEASVLPDEVMQELIQGKYVEEIETLYGFLESYSS